MKNNLLMSVDLGTSFVKIGVYDLKSNCISSASSQVQSDAPSAGVFIQKGEDIFLSVIECMKSVAQQLGSRAEDIGVVAFTGQMSGFMGVDREWNDITTWSSSLDSRYMPYAERQLADLKDDFFLISGTNAPQMAPKFEWFKTEHPHKAAKIAKYVMISSYVIGKLGDVPIENAAIDKSYIQWTGLADVKNGVWSDRLCKAINMNKDHLPKIVEANHICGYLSDNMARITGLKSGIPLVSGAGDKIAGCLGAAVTQPGEMIFEASSYGALSCCINEYKLDMDARRMDIVPSAIHGLFIAMHFVAGSGITLDWFNETFSNVSSMDKSSLFSKIEEEVERIKPGCDGLMAIGLPAGSSQPLDGTLRGMWMGFDWSHKRAHFYRALLESYSYDFALALKSLKRLYPHYKMDTIKIIGGGAKSEVWTQMNADVHGKTYQHLNRKDVSLWGAAIIAGNAIGIFDNVAKTAAKYVHIQKEVHPDMEMHRRYQPFLKLYEEYLTELPSYYKRIQQCQAGI